MIMAKILMHLEIQFMNQALINCGDNAAHPQVI
jgi:hypothetical protein